VPLDEAVPAEQRPMSDAVSRYYHCHLTRTSAIHS
jgi:hypothetical protein